MDRFSKDAFLHQVIGNCMAVREAAIEAGNRKLAVLARKECEAAIDCFDSLSLFNPELFPLAHSLVDDPELYLRFYED